MERYDDISVNPIKKYTEDKIINEIAKIVCNACEFGCGFDGECDLGDNYKLCSICQETATEIYKRIIEDGV